MQFGILFIITMHHYLFSTTLDWIEFMKRQDVKRVCCLLPDHQLTRYCDLLGTYQQHFGLERLCWVPIEDFHLCDQQALTQEILSFLAEAEKLSEKVVVHCSGGIGRTGHVLAAWLVSSRGLANSAAIAAVRKTGRNPYEAAIFAVIRGRNPFKAIKDLNALLNDCHSIIDKRV